MSVTECEYRLLAALQKRLEERGLDKAWDTIPNLQGDGCLGPDGSSQGYWQTASSLVRKSMAVKRRIGRQVHLRITPPGIAKVREGPPAPRQQRALFFVTHTRREGES